MTDEKSQIDLAYLRQMLKIRAMEEAILELRREDLVAGSIHLCIGQESVPAGVIPALDSRDRVLTTYRGHGWALAKGVPLDAILGEVLGKTTGTNGGRGGSAYFTSPEHGFVGENSIVAAGLPIANGVAMGLANEGTGGVAVVTFGDGATNQGGAHEALVFAIARHLPVLFVCENNSWSEMTPITETVPAAQLWERAGGYGMPSQRVNGTDVHAVAEAATAAIARIRQGGGPEFLEVSVPRIFGHYNGDIQQYRPESDKLDHKGRDPIDHLILELALDTTVLEAIRSEVEDEVNAAVARAKSAPAADPRTAADHVVSTPQFGAVQPLPSEGKELAYGLAVNRALMTELDERDNVVVFGEDIAIPGGSFGVTRNLRKNHGERVFDTPISETAILGAAIGASLEGLRPIVEIMWTDFLLVAFDQIANQAANVRYISGGRVTAPLTIRMQQGITPGSCAQHSQSLEALITHVPGIKVGMPSNSADAYAMTRAAVADDDPVVLIESRALYLEKGLVDVDAPVEKVGGARVRRDGEDLLIVTWGRMTNIVLAAADELAAEGIAARVLDLRWLAPLDEDTIAASISAVGGRVLIVHEANLTGGFGGEIAARLAERHYDSLTAPVIRVGLPDVRVPSAPLLQEALMPSTSEIVSAARRLLVRQNSAA